MHAPHHYLIRDVALDFLMRDEILKNRTLKPEQGGKKDEKIPSWCCCILLYCTVATLYIVDPMINPNVYIISSLIQRLSILKSDLNKTLERQQCEICHIIFIMLYNKKRFCQLCHLMKSNLKTQTLTNITFSFLAMTKTLLQTEAH